ncbi:proline--tRNA ligase [Candidatus Marinamargulisbacteria bacterium SCGC AG-333-B06]|nr:proline--tRNA ligase [Candidatus Marinamargulisbacteria bacterium SCGC AG-333-B06]
MKYSQLFIQTFKETPTDAHIISHQLLHRAGFIQKSGAGLYNYSPLMMKVIHRTQAIIREELQRVGALEISMSLATPSELWKESKRWEELGSLMVQFQDRMNRDLCLSPTNEEAVVDYFRKVAKSYKQLPVCLYQINTKFRDELRPRFGLMRAREFSMKDAYSFHIDKACLDKTYDQMFKAYSRIFDRMGLTYMAVEADGGAMADGDAKTHEFHVVADTGEDELIMCKQEKWAANSEMAVTKRQTVSSKMTHNPITEVDTGDNHSIKDVSRYLNESDAHCLKSVLLKGKKDDNDIYVMACCLGDDEINLTKCLKHSGIKFLECAEDHDLQSLGLTKGVLGPIQLNNDAIHILIDSQVNLAASYIVGSNKKGVHLTNVIIKRDIPTYKQLDIRISKEGDVSVTGNPIELCRGIEVGHIFQLGDKYTKALKASVLDNNGKAIYPMMGCYGIGLGRAIAAVVEQASDDKGMVWPSSIAPFQVVIIPLKSKDESIAKAGQDLYELCQENGIDAILDDRTVSPGFKFKDADLMGFPHQLVIGEGFKQTKEVEYKSRKTGEKKMIMIETSLRFLKTIL